MAARQDARVVLGAVTAAPQNPGMPRAFDLLEDLVDLAGDDPEQGYTVQTACQAASALADLAYRREVAAVYELGVYEPDGRELHVETLEELADAWNYAVAFHALAHAGDALERQRAETAMALARAALHVAKLARLARSDTR